MSPRDTCLSIILDNTSTIKMKIHGFYRKLFPSDRGDRGSEFNMEEVMSCILVQMTEPMNHMLTRMTTAEEVHVAAFQIEESRAPEPDGFSWSFFQKN